MRKIILGLAAVLTVSACETWETSSLDSETKKIEVAPATSQTIALSSEAFDDSKYMKLGDLKVTVNKTTAFHSAPTIDAVQSKLREDAAKLGATNVVNVEISDVEITPFSWGTRTGTGTAVKPK